MSVRSLITGVLIVLLMPALAGAREAPPIPYRGAPLIPWAKKIGEHRFRSPRNYDDTLDYYRKTISRNEYIHKKKIINNSEVRAVHYQNTHPRRRWDGLNIYEYKGSTVIFVVFTDKELARIEEEKKNKPAGKRRKKKRNRRRRKRKK